MLSGFLNHFATEARSGVLPIGQNSPQRVAHGLYAEQLSGTAFTAPRHENLRSWLYRLRPSVVHGPFTPSAAIARTWKTAPFEDGVLSPQQRRWSPLPVADAASRDFLDGVFTLAGAGHALEGRGLSTSAYAFGKPMGDRFFYNSDGELVFLPQQGRIELHTEMGRMIVAPLQLAVIPRGVRFQVNPLDGLARGYLGENYGATFRLPGLGPIGSNGLANPRDFEAPTAWFEDRAGKFRLVNKFGGAFFEADLDRSPLDVVAWHGNYTPYVYDLRRFNTINSVSFDHPDPSIFTVLTSPSDTPGTANCDFVIFPPRWMVAEHTFRPPWFHRNLMSEFMGLLEGAYDAKGEGFVPGGASLHNCMSGHGPDAEAFEKASHEALKPVRYEKTMAFMFETRLPYSTPKQALETAALQADYWKCWQGLRPAKI
jgi:homogentisate 1,2-dioxygenase